MSNTAEGLIRDPSQDIAGFRSRQARRLVIQLHGLTGPLWIVLSIALLLRTALPLAALATHHDSSVFLENDTETYLRPAEALLTSGAFNTASHPEIVRTPGYPLFLMPGLLSEHVKAVTIALQIMISTLTVFLVYLTSKTMFSSTTAYCCASLYAIEPLSIFYCSQLLSETLFTFLVVLFLYQTMCYIKQAKLPILLTAALALAGATYVRPVSYYLPIALMPIVVYASACTCRRSKAIIHGLAFFLFFLALVAPWQIRNYRVSGYSGFSAISDVNLYFYRGASIIAKKTNQTLSDVQKELGFNSWEQYIRSHPEQATWSYAREYQFMGREGLRLIQHNLLIYTPIHLAGMVRVTANPGGIVYSLLFKNIPAPADSLGTVSELKVLRTNYPFSFYMTIFLALLLLCYIVLAVSGVTLVWRRERIATVLLITVGVYFVLVSSGAESAGRFRHPIMPIVCVFAGYTLALLGRQQIQIND